MIKGRLKLCQTALVIGEGLFQRFQQLSVYSTKTAVAHDQNMIACFGIFDDFGNKGIEVVANVQFAA